MNDRYPAGRLQLPIYEQVGECKDAQRGSLSDQPEKLQLEKIRKQQI